MAGAILALWLVVTLLVWVLALRKSRSIRASSGMSAAQEALLATGPALPLIIYPGGAIEGGQRLADALGLEALPPLFSALDTFDASGTAALSQSVTDAARTGKAFDLRVCLVAAHRTMQVQGAPAPAPIARGAVLLWFWDTSQADATRAGLAQSHADVDAALTALTRLIEAAPFPIWHRGPDLQLALVNAAYVHAVDAPDAMTVIGAGIELLEGGDADPRAAAAAARSTSATSSRTLPVTVGGARRILNIVDVPLVDGDMEAGVAGYAIDVHEREQAKADLARFGRAQRDMLDRLSSGVAQFGPDRALSFSNRPFARLFGMAADWLAEHPEFDRVLERMRENHKLPEVRDFPAWKAERRDWFVGLPDAIEEAWLLPGGAHLRVVAQPLPDGGLLLIFEDRSEQVQLASARDTLLRVRAATFENLFEAIGVFAGDGRLYLWNDRFRRLWGLEEAQLAGHPRVDELVPLLAPSLSNPAHANLVRELVRSATSERQQRSGRVLLTDGRHFEFAAVPLPDGNALFTMLDVTDSRRIETALRERTEALEESDRVKTAFVSGMSYELRTPLTSIAGFAQMLAGGYGGALEGPAQDYVGAILEATDRLAQLIDDVLDLTRTEAGAELVRGPVDLRTLCLDAMEAFAADAAQRGVTLDMQLEDGVGTVEGEPRRLREVVMYLLRHALHHLDPGARILLHATGDRAGAMITVSDNGSGIDGLDRTVDRFHRMYEGEGAASIGLGLPVARHFVEAHGGTIRFQAEPGLGTSVTIHLPRGLPPIPVTP